MTLRKTVKLGSIIEMDRQSIMNFKNFDFALQGIFKELEIEVNPSFNNYLLMVEFSPEDLACNLSSFLAEICLSNIQLDRMHQVLKENEPTFIFWLSEENNSKRRERAFNSVFCKKAEILHQF